MPTAGMKQPMLAKKRGLAIHQRPLAGLRKFETEKRQRLVFLNTLYCPSRSCSYERLTHSWATPYYTLLTDFNVFLEIVSLSLLFLGKTKFNSCLKNESKIGILKSAGAWWSQLMSFSKD